MRVVSMVPSWTETLLKANVEVVGRTGYCIAPPELVKKIPVVGGTKNIHWNKVKALNPDLLILDKEENPKSMAEDSPYEFLATHVQSVTDVPNALIEMGQRLINKQLLDWAQAWQKIIDDSEASSKSLDLLREDGKLQGLIEWISKPKAQIDNVLYLIWKDPWMVVSANTFIGSMLMLKGIRVPQFEQKYPQVDLRDYSAENTLLLFSTEPYDFLKIKKELSKLDFPCAIVDGRAYSWFGVHSLNFLQLE